MIYNATNYKKSPHPNVSVVYGITVATYYNKRGSFIGDKPWDIDWSKFENYLIKLPSQPIICDIEHWRLNDGDSVEFHDSMMLYRSIYKFMKEVRPDVPIGAFAAPPAHAGAVSTFRKTHHAAFKAWQVRCEQVKHLSDYLDWICPSLYWETKSFSRASEYAQAMLAEAGRFRSMGKRIVPFIMPRPVSLKSNGAAISPRWFRRWMNDSVYPYSDDIIVWDYGQYKTAWPKWLTEMIGDS